MSTLALAQERLFGGQKRAFREGVAPMPARPATTRTQEIKLAHSPDSDDAFMFYALAKNRVKAPGLKFTHVLSDIETLNQSADRDMYDVKAISVSSYTYI